MIQLLVGFRMFQFIFLVSALCCLHYSIALVIFPPGRIIGGEDASIRDFPYQLSLEVRYRHICGAAILNEKHALTAAHCTSNPASAMTISGGSDLLNSPYRKRVDVKRYVVHPEYDENSLEFDIAVLFLLDPLVLNGRTMQPVALPTANDKLSDGTMVKVSGWGVTHQYNSKPSNKLQVVEVPMVNTQKCTYAYRRVHKITGNMICAGYLGKGGKDSCQGDSGGPLTHKGVMYGIVSFGHGCALPNYPGIYTNVASLRSWIDKTIK